MQLNQIRNFLSNDARLARACARQYQTWSVQILDGFALRLIQTML
jgi:hypothetical protein